MPKSYQLKFQPHPSGRNLKVISLLESVGTPFVPEDIVESHTFKTDTLLLNVIERPRIFSIHFSNSREVSMPGIPREVACPHCGGYVRGHQWIGTTTCSVSVVH